MIKAEWTSNDALSAEQTTQTNAPNALNVMDCVSRKAAIEAINELHDKPNAWLDLAVDALEDLPSAQPERTKGKWIWMGEKGDSRFMCSVCKSKENVPTCNGKPTIWWYCPNCGADMRKETEDGS